MPFLIHAWNVGFVVFVSLFQGGISVFYVLLFLPLFEGGDGAELIEDIVLFFEAQCCEEMFEIVEVELPFPSFINNSEQTSNFFS